jgi:hypothetical protein
MLKTRIASTLLASATLIHSVQASDRPRTEAPCDLSGATQTTAACISRSADEGDQGSDGPRHAGLESDDIAYLTQLALIRGHLHVGMDLYRQGENAAAQSHMKHPDDELYTALVLPFAARGVVGFAPELGRLAALVEGGAPVPEVETAYFETERKIADAELRVSARGLPAMIAVIARLVRTAAEEYAVGVNGGAVVNAHEYQDALGFVRIAGDLLAGLDPAERVGADDHIGAVAQELQAIAKAWPSVVPPAVVTTDAVLIADAAAHIESVVAAASKAP